MVNISPLQSQRPNFVENVRFILDKAQLSPEKLLLEIAEGKVLPATDIVRVNLEELQALGVNIAMDDFGTGYSSLQYQEQSAFDQIKIDRSFPKNVDHLPTNRAIFSAMIGTGEALDTRIIAKASETKEHLDFLIELGCDHVQGYFVGSPMVPERFKELSTKRPLFSASALNNRTDLLVH